MVLPPCRHGALAFLGKVATTDNRTCPPGLLAFLRRRLCSNPEATWSHSSRGAWSGQVFVAAAPCSLFKSFFFTSLGKSWKSKKWPERVHSFLVKVRCSQIFWLPSSLTRGGMAPGPQRIPEGRRGHAGLCQWNTSGIGNCHISVRVVRATTDLPRTLADPHKQEGLCQDGTSTLSSLCQKKKIQSTILCVCWSPEIWRSLLL